MSFTHKNTKGKVYVGLSGGVDSSVSALRLIEEGYEVVGVFIKTWQPDFLVCNWEAERLDAMRVAAHLGIPFYTCDAEAAYRDEVAQYMIAEYTAGRTPNPDVMCNQYVKFGAFLSYALDAGAAKIATGHYAQVKEKGGIFHLLRGLDTNKDQSYFLWTLTQEQLSKTLFPVGDTVKDTIREEAVRAGLLTGSKKDSQGICFLGDVDVKDFLSHYVDLRVGDVLNEDGDVVGTHDGALYYTLGQRHGFTITTTEASRTPQYVVAKDVHANTITVAPHVRKVEGRKVVLTRCNFIQPIPTSCEAQFRYRQPAFGITILVTGDTTAELTVDDVSIELPSLGQSCVIYDGIECLGGGIIDAIV